MDHREYKSSLTLTGNPIQLYKGGSRNFREGFPYHSQWFSNFTAIFDGNYKFLPSIDLEKFYGQLIQNFEMEGVSGNPRNPPKTAPEFRGHQNLYSWLV